MSNNNSSGCGGGFSGLLTIVFVALKLTNVIDWQWIWVVSPLWISLALAIVFLIIVLIMGVIAGIMD